MEEKKVEEEKKEEKGVNKKELPEKSLVGEGEDLHVLLLTSYQTLALGQQITVRVLHFSSWSSFFVCAEADYPQLERFQVRSPLTSLIKCSLFPM